MLPNQSELITTTAIICASIQSFLNFCNLHAGLVHDASINLMDQVHRFTNILLYIAEKMQIKKLACMSMGNKSCMH